MLYMNIDSFCNIWDSSYHLLFVLLHATHACLMMELKFIENPTLIYKIKAAIIEKSNL